MVANPSKPTATKIPRLPYGRTDELLQLKPRGDINPHVIPIYRSRFHASLALLLLLLLSLAMPGPGSAQPLASPSAPARPEEPARLLERPLLPAFGGLSDGGPVLTPYIDKLAFNARVDFLFATDSPQRQQAIVIPYGFSFAVLHLVEGGIFTHHALWKIGTHSQSSNGPLVLNLKARLWPWFRKDPNQHFTVVAAYQHELRVGPFDGSNQLGLLSDAAALRIAASWPLWLLDLGASLGAIYDYQGRFGTGELRSRRSTLSNNCSGLETGRYPSITTVGDLVVDVE